MKLKYLALVAVFVSFSAVSSFAADQSSGCGLGWYVFKKNSLLSSSLRNTTNAVFLNSTFGMTFGTSNCAKHSIVMNEKEDVYFAEANQERLAVEMAEGKGEYITAFARTLGCIETAVDDFSVMSQKNYSQIFSHEGITSVEVLQNVKSEMRKNQVLRTNCTRAVI